MQLFSFINIHKCMLTCPKEDPSCLGVDAFSFFPLFILVRRAQLGLAQLGPAEHV